jgi:hypothetical protein
MNAYTLQQSLELAGITVPVRVMEAAAAHARAVDALARAEYRKQEAEAALKESTTAPESCYACGSTPYRKRKHSHA